MARKAYVNAEKEIRGADFRLWRLLVRNSYFQDDLGILHEKYLLFLDAEKGVKEGGREMWGSLRDRRVREYIVMKDQLKSKWGLARIPTLASILPPIDSSGANASKVKVLEIGYTNDVKNSPIDLPVVDVKWQNYPYLVKIQVDVTKPMHFVLTGIQSELRKIYKNKSSNRNRPDNLDFGLKVFDQVQYEHMDFKEAARKLGRPLSTVRSAYLSVARKIAFVRTFPTASTSVLEQLIPKKKRCTPDKYPGEIDQCPDSHCRLAQKPEDLCSAHKEWIKQDQVSLRELLAPNPSAIEHARSRR